MYKDLNTKICDLQGKEHVRIVLLDSGLGGLAICAELERVLNEQRFFPRATLSYFNVWPENGRGYNSLETVAERVHIFNRALEAVNTYGPDLILIACNTLSVLYGRTHFSRTSAIPVVDIIDFGVDMMHAHLSATPDSQVLILGTRTTVSEEAHRRQLVQKGIDPGRIAAQQCHGVATEIEKEPDGLKVTALVAGYMEAAVEKLDGRSSVAAALCCTHYGFSRGIFGKELRKRLPVHVEILDPNRAMGRFLLQAKCHPGLAAASINIDMRSKIELTPDGVQRIAAIIRPQAQGTADALENYVYQPDLF